MDLKTHIWTGETITLKGRPTFTQINLVKDRKYDISIEKIYFSRVLNRKDYNGLHPIRDNKTNPDFILITQEEYSKHYYSNDILAGTMLSNSLTTDLSNPNFAEEYWRIQFPNHRMIDRFENPELFIDLEEFRDNQINTLIN
jgi:hypothetical protein